MELQRIDSSSVNAYGERAPVWTTYARRWAAIEPAAGSESLNAGALTPTATHLIRLRHAELTNVKAEHRVVAGSRTFHVVSVLNIDERDRELALACRELVE